MLEGDEVTRKVLRLERAKVRLKNLVNALRLELQALRSLRANDLQHIEKLEQKLDAVVRARVRGNQ